MDFTSIYREERERRENEKEREKRKNFYFFLSKKEKKKFYTAIINFRESEREREKPRNFSTSRKNLQPIIMLLFYWPIVFLLKQQ